MSMIKKKMEEKLEKISYIWYFIAFKEQTKALCNLRNKVNVIRQAFTF